jgi:hypothetical protein
LIRKRNAILKPNALNQEAPFQPLTPINLVKVAQETETETLSFEVKNITSRAFSGMGLKEKTHAIQNTFLLVDLSYDLGDLLRHFELVVTRYKTTLGLMPQKEARKGADYKAQEELVELLLRRYCYEEKMTAKKAFEAISKDLKKYRMALAPKSIQKCYFPQIKKKYNVKHYKELREKWHSLALYWSNRDACELVKKHDMKSGVLQML